MSEDSDSETSASSEEPEQKTKGRKKKEDKGPTRPRSAFMFFSQARRPVLKKANPGLSFGELGRLVGKEWAAASDSTKSPFEKKAEDDKVRFVEEGGVSKRGAKKTGPKGPRSAFMYYSQEKRAALKAEDPSLSFADLGREVGKAWNKATQSEKDKFQKLADKDKQRYAAEKAANPDKSAPVKRKAKKEVSAEEESEESESEDAE